jgi:hypothetical protein
MMRRLKQILVLLFCFCSPAYATSYFIAPASHGGNDSNNGTSPSTPWLSPNHAVNCGDVLQAAAGTTYAAANFAPDKWGTVTCLGNNNVAWLKCVTFDACKISDSGGSGQSAIDISASYWGVQGFETTSSGVSQACFTAAPPTSAANIHHIIFANNVANGCLGSGLNAFSNGSAGVDYIAIIGNIAYNGSQGADFCYSGIGVAAPTQVDSLPGTHVFISGNFSYSNFDPSMCHGTAPTDGEGIIFDTWTANSYTAQGVIDNNVVLSNGGSGIQLTFTGSAPIYIRHNTAWGNNGDMNRVSGVCGEILMNGNNIGPVRIMFSAEYLNLAVTNATNGCGGYPIYAYDMGFGDVTDHIYTTWGYSAAGTNNRAGSSNGFAFGLGNIFGTNANLANPSTPSAPSCGGFANVPACMATVVANFTPTNPAANAFGYQKPLTTNVFDPLFPQWLCNVNLPSGLVTIGCTSMPLLPPTITGVKGQ